MQNMQQSWKNSYLFGVNADFIEQLYDSYLENPSSVNEKWRNYFESIQDAASDKDVNHDLIKQKFAILTANPLMLTNNVANNLADNGLQNQVFALINGYRNFGHQFAKLDPLEYQIRQLPKEIDYNHYKLQANLTESFLDNDNLSNAKSLVLKDIIAKYQSIYCASSGFEFGYISNTDERLWLQSFVENNYLSYQLNENEKKRVLQKLTEAEGLERYLHTKYVGQKRFSLEGGDSLIPMLDRILTQGAIQNISEFHIAMAHRGRLNTLVNIAGKSPAKLFAEFDGNYPNYDFVTSGDVKYHKGYTCKYTTLNSQQVKVELAFNPSHLETVNPVVEGIVRASQDKMVTDKFAALAILIHGDSALIGLGTNQAVFNMSQTRAYNTYGTIHIVVNNQVGFTTSEINDNRSSRYCTDIAKMVEAPVIHVNGDDLTAVCFAIDLAVNYRQKFAKDIMIDLVCFRRHGHNEADDPTLTQPIMYAKIKQHLGVRRIFAEQLIKQGVINDEYEQKLVEDYRNGLISGEHVAAKDMQALSRYNFSTEKFLLAKWNDLVNTKITQKKLTELGLKITKIPDAPFKLHPTVARMNEARKLIFAGQNSLDFGTAETLAYASLLDEGINVRFSGEDSCRGTFSHRHAVWHDVNNPKEHEEATYTPLKTLENKSKFNIYDSILNEEGVLGFEYGYSLNAINDLVIWEAQFGDFANGAQVIIDQFIVSGEAKWGNLSRLVMMLPHGYDGQGPEHSSARLERFLQLSAENNIQIVVPSNAAQIFHVLRRQVKSNYIKPLVLFISKKLLRFEEAKSPINALVAEEFFPVIADLVAKETTTKIILCSGQIYYDLIKTRAEHKLDNKIAILRIEQLYPLPTELIKTQLAKYTKAKQLIWVQEEPYNQGAWLQIREQLDQLHEIKFNVVARPAAAAPACGNSAMHSAQLEALLKKSIVD